MAAGRKTKPKIHGMVQMAIMASLICVLAPLSIPIGPVPISFANLAIMLSVYMIGWKKTLGSLMCYILLGMVGLPVFSGFSGGIGKILGPTGGYILGYFPLALASGVFLEMHRGKFLHFLGFVLGAALCYFLGTAWYCYQAGVALDTAMGACVLPFIPGDLIKILIAMILGPVIRRGLCRAGFIE